MNADAQALDAPSSPPPPRSARSRPSSWSSSGSGSSGSGGFEYTSLRDVITDGGGGSSSDVHEFDTSNITIRNQLLKHAASAYLQSAIVVTPRERGCLSKAWSRMMQRRRCRILLLPCPVRRRAAAFAGSVRRALARLCGCVTCVWWT